MAAFTGECNVYNVDDIPMKFMKNAYNIDIPNIFHPSTTEIYEDYLYPEWLGDLELNKDNALRSLGGGLDRLATQHIIAHLDHSGFNSIGTSSKCKNQNLSITDLDPIVHTPSSIYKIFYSVDVSQMTFPKIALANI